MALTVGARAAQALTACSAGDIVAQDPGCPPGTGPCSITKLFQVGDGCVLDFGSRAVTITDNASGPVINARSVTVTIRAGSLVVAPGGLIDGRGTDTTAPGNQGGSITVATSGAVTLQKSTAGVGRIDVSATSAAGGISINAGGSVAIAGALKAERLSTYYPAANGGTISISAGMDITSGATSLISALGGDQSALGGGDVELFAGGKILLSGPVDIRGSDGGILGAYAGDAIALDKVMGNATGDGGDGAQIDIEAGTSVQLNDQLTASGSASLLGSGSGGGGLVTVAADFGDLTITATGDIFANGPDPDGAGGEIDLTAQGALSLQSGSTTSVRGGGPSGYGGYMLINSNLKFQLDGTFDASGGLNGGEIDVSAGTDITLNGAVNVSGRALGSIGGIADIEAGNLAPGALTIANLVDVTGGDCDATLNCGSGGITTLTGCNVTVTTNGTVNANAPTGGLNSLSAREQMTINGKVEASTTTASGTDGENDLEYPLRKPVAMAAGAVMPDPVLIPRDTCTSFTQLYCLLPCPTCGNGIVEFPETCDNDVAPAGTLPKSCDGCSAFCTVENCNDGLTCTTDSCDQVLGCRNVPLPPPCTEPPTQTPTVTGTITPPTGTSTPRSTATPSPTPPPTATPTATQTPTVTPTATPTPSKTPTPTPSVTPTPPPTNTLTPSPLPFAGCAAVPVASCRTAPKGVLNLVSYLGSNGYKKLRWRWSRGAATNISDFGDPVNGATSYRLCIYDENAGIPTLKLGILAPAGGLCKGGKPCWIARTTGYDYIQPDLTSNGLKFVLRAGAQGRARLAVVGKGPILPMPAPAGARFFQQDTHVTVQLVQSDNGLCWESVYPAPAHMDTLVVFRDTWP